MRIVKVRLTDAMYDAAVKEAAKRGHATPSGNGVSGLMRGSLRYVLNKAGYVASDLDEPDHEFMTRVPTHITHGLSEVHRGE